MKTFRKGTGRFKVPTADSADNVSVRDVVGNKTDTIAGDSLIAATKRIEASLGGAAIQMRVEQSKSGTVEEDAIMAFGISIMDVDTGAVASGSIDITSISAVLEKSTGGAAFSAAGITQPTFAKAAGLVSVDYRFLLAEWEIGDVYKLEVSGIEATIGSDTAYVKTMIWSNTILEEANIETKIDAIQADIGDPSARTNLQTLLALLGNPDAAGKSIYGNIGDFVGQTNLQTLLAVLAVPDTAAKGLFVELATDRLDSGTHGLAALKTLIDAIQTDVGDFSALSNFTSLLNQLGIPDVAGKDLYTLLVTDRLDDATNGLANLKALIDAIQVDVGDFSALSNFSSLLDQLGIPDVAGKDLYTLLVTDRLDDATNGLANLKTLIDAIQTDLGDPSSRTNLQTIMAMLGNPDAAGKTLYGNVGDFVGQTNLQTLLAALAIPDTSGKGLFVELATDRLDSGTHGLSALKTLIDAIQTDLGNPSGRTNLQTILAMLGNPDTAGKTVYEFVKNIREVPINGSSLPIANTLSDILHKDGSYTFDNTTDSLEAIKDLLDVIFNVAMPSSPAEDSVHDYLEHGVGEPSSKALSIAGDGATSMECFVITGSVKILELWIDVTAVGDSVDFADVKFDLFPTGGAAVDITATVDGSGANVGDQFIKTADKGTALVYINNDLAVVTEGAAGPPPQVGLFTHFIATKKNGAVTNVRLTFNGDANTDITATIYCRWHKLSADGDLAAA